MEDAELVAQALAGSQDAYRELVVRYQRPVYNLIARMVRDPGIAEELAQESFLKAINALASFDPERKFSSWLFKIAHNTTIDHLRRKAVPTVPLEGGGEDERSLLEALPAAGAESPQAFVERGDLARALEAAILELRPEYREVLLLRFKEELAYEEIADITDLPLGTVKTHLHRARKQLAAALREAGWEAVGG